MTMLIRAFEEADRAAVIALWARCGLQRRWNDPSADIDLACGSPEATILVGVAEGTLAASVMVGFDGHRGWVYYLAVDPERQGRGFGRRMMQAAEDWLRERNAPKIQLMVRNDNETVQAFYKALGYEVMDVTVIGKRFAG